MSRDAAARVRDHVREEIQAFPSWREFNWPRLVQDVKYLYDVTITHNDVEYMKKVRLPRCPLGQLTHGIRR